MSCEQYVFDNPNKLIAYCIYSSSIFTLNQIGVNTFTLYKMFNKSEIFERWKDRIDKRYILNEPISHFHLERKK